MIKPALIALALLAAKSTQAATFVYDINIVHSVTDFVRGTIATDCINCFIISSSHIVDYDLTISIGTQTAILQPDNSTALARDLMPTERDLSIDNSPQDEINLRFINVSTGDFFSLGYCCGYPVRPSEDFLRWQIGTASVVFNQQINPIGTRAAVPEPATWAMLLLGFVLLSVAAPTRRRSRRPCPTAR